MGEGQPSKEPVVGGGGGGQQGRCHRDEYSPRFSNTQQCGAKHGTGLPLEGQPLDRGDSVGGRHPMPLVSPNQYPLYSDQASLEWPCSSRPTRSDHRKAVRHAWGEPVHGQPSLNTCGQSVGRWLAVISVSVQLTALGLFVALTDHRGDEIGMDHQERAWTLPEVKGHHQVALQPRDCTSQVRLPWNQPTRRLSHLTTLRKTITIHLKRVLFSATFQLPDPHQDIHQILYVFTPTMSLHGQLLCMRDLHALLKQSGRSANCLERKARK